MNVKLNKELVEAILKDDSKIVSDLLIYGADPNGHIDDDQLTPLFFAVQNNSLRCAFLLLAAGANSNQYSPHAGVTPLKIAKLNNFIDMVALLENADIKRDRSSI